MTANRKERDRLPIVSLALRAVFICVAMLSMLPAGCVEEVDAIVAEAPPPLLPLTMAEQPEAVDDLLVLMHQRLQIMDEVAKSKWNLREPIHDPEREQRLLERMASQTFGDPASVGISRAFFQAQIDAAKEVQQANFDRWHLEGQLPFPEVVDSYQELRPEISRLSGEMQRLLYRLGPCLYQNRMNDLIASRAEMVLVGGQITPDLRSRMIQPLLVRPDPVAGQPRISTESHN